MTSPFTMLGAADAVACEGDACVVPFAVDPAPEAEEARVGSVPSVPSAS